MPTSIGFKDKLYWRPVARAFHCFAYGGKGSGWRSLCGRHAIDGTDGGTIDRPPAIHRCGLCDGAEADRRGWDGSGPERGNWRARWEAHFAAAPATKGEGP